MKRGFLLGLVVLAGCRGERKSDADAAAATVTTAPVSHRARGSLPPDPSTVAAAVDPTVTSSIETTAAFLYSGPDPIQTGVAPGVIRPEQIAVLRGKVLDGKRGPAPGVTVSVVDHPELGSTLTRQDGGYDLAVNGGGPLVVRFVKQGMVPLDRMTQTPWRDFVTLPEVVLRPLDEQVTQVTLGAPGWQVARAKVVSDRDVLANPRLLSDLNPAHLQFRLAGRMPSGWRIERLGQGSRKGQGFVLRQYTARGNPTGRQIRWHPGGGHHGPNPYWRVLDGRTISEIIPAAIWPW